MTTRCRDECCIHSFTNTSAAFSTDLIVSATSSYGILAPNNRPVKAHLWKKPLPAVTTRTQTVTVFCKACPGHHSGVSRLRQEHRYVLGPTHRVAMSHPLREKVLKASMVNPMVSVPTIPRAPSATPNMPRSE